MIKLSSGSNYSNKYSLEKVGDFPKLHQKLELPRHISSLESRSEDRSYLDKVKTLSTCPLSQSPTDAAWDILKYQLSDRHLKQKHLANLRSNLEHRLSVAQVRGDRKLVQILLEEFRQLQNNGVTSS